MANIKSSKKDIKQIAKKTPQNHELQATVKNYIKKCEKAIEAGNKEEAMANLKSLQSNIDKAAKKSIIKKNTADRQKSRLSQKVKGLK